ncbi:MAG: hypothetical protein AAFZ80_12050, partial [Cyanobacteria bacterium P01_A01_bin.105]
GTPQDLMSAHLNQPVPIPARLTDPLTTIVLTALEKIPARRYPSAVEMLAALQDVDPQPSPLFASDPFAALTLVNQPFVGEAITPLRQPVAQLWICPTEPTRLLARSQQQLTIYQRQSDTLVATGSGETTAPTIGLHTTSHGPCLTTESGLYAVDAHPTSPRRLQPLVRWSADTLGIPARSGGWYGAVNPTAITFGPLRRQRHWRHPVDVVRQQPLPFECKGTLCSALLADAHHWVAAETQPDQTLQLHVMARRGAYLGALPVELPLEQLSPTLLPYRLLALEPAAKSLVLVDLKPFRVMRIGLEIVPHRAVAMPWGYAILSEAGQLLLLDRELAPIGCIDVPATATALLPTQPHELLLATWDSQTGGIYAIDLRQFDLDILF